MVYNCETYRECLIKRIQALSQDLIKLAPDLVGEADLITSFEIHLKFGHDEVPTITLIREHIGEQASRIQL